LDGQGSSVRDAVTDRDAIRFGVVLSEQESVMLKRSATAAAIVTVAALGSFSTMASAQGNPAAGALIGGGIGAAIGHSVNGTNGAWVGAALGAITGAAIATNAGGGYVAAAPYYAPPAAYVAPAPAYYAPPAYYPPAVAYYRPAPVYVAPRPVVYLPPPRYIVRPHPVVVPVRGWGYGRHGGYANVAYASPR
jgi:hypothetical protein